MKQNTSIGLDRKLFRFGPSFRGGSTGLRLANREAVLPEGQKTLGPPWGEHGFPEFSERPVLRPEKKSYKRPPKDLEQFQGYWLVSERLKRVLEATDPGAVAFAPCDVYYISGKPIEENFYLADVIRELDALDEAASTVKIVRYGDDKVYDLSGTLDLKFDLTIVGDSHIFWQRHMPEVICDSTLREACVSAGIKDPEVFSGISSK